MKEIHSFAIEELYETWGNDKTNALGMVSTLAVMTVVLPGALLSFSSLIMTYWNVTANIIRLGTVR